MKSLLLKVPNYKGYNILVVLSFTIFECIFYKSSSLLVPVVAILEYLVIFFYLSKNIETGFAYFITFTLLSAGWGNFFDTQIPLNFWGVRIGPFSVNIIFSVLLLIFAIKKRFPIKIFWDFPIALFLTIFIFYILITGLINVLLGNNFQDNYLQDALTYIPFFIYLPIIYIIRKEIISEILRYITFSTIFFLVLNFFLGNRSIYAGQEFLPNNAFSLFLFPFIILLANYIFTKREVIIITIFIVILLLSGLYNISGKHIIVFIILMLYFSYKNFKRQFLIVVPFLIIVVFFSNPIMVLLRDFFIARGNVAIPYKFDQIITFLSLKNFYLVALYPSSIGNLAAELITLKEYLFTHYHWLILGKGAGAGIPDIYDFLAPFSGASGYAEKDYLRNDYFKLHLPVYEVALKGGVVFLFWYISIIIKLFNKKSHYFLLLISFTFIFYVNKEMLLLTVLIAYFINIIEFR